MAFSKIFRRNSNYLFLSRIISSLGTSFSIFSLQLFAYHNTNNPTHIGMQWAVIAIAILVATRISPKINFFKNDKQAVIYLDFIQALVALIPLFFKENPILSCYITVFLINFLETVQSGFFESLIGNSYLEEKKIDLARNWILGKNKTGLNIGSLIGFSLAGIVTTKMGFDIAFIADSISFILSAFFIIFISILGTLKEEKVSPASFSLVFSKNLFNLSIAQICACFAIYMFNGIWFVTLKNNFNISDSKLNIVFIIQFIGSVFGSYLQQKISEKKLIPNTVPFIMRFLQGLILVSLIFAFSYNQILLIFFVLNFLVSFSLPCIQGMFQKSVKREELRGVGVARLALNSISGAIAAAISSILLNYISYTWIFFISAIISGIGSIFFYKHIAIEKQKANNEELEYI